MAELCLLVSATDLATHLSRPILAKHLGDTLSGDPTSKDSVDRFGASGDADDVDATIRNFRGGGEERWLGD